MLRYLMILAIFFSAVSSAYKVPSALADIHVPPAQSQQAESNFDFNLLSEDARKACCRSHEPAKEYGDVSYCNVDKVYYLPTVAPVPFTRAGAFQPCVHTALIQVSSYRFLRPPILN